MLFDVVKFCYLRVSRGTHGCRVLGVLFPAQRRRHHVIIILHFESQPRYYLTQKLSSVRSPSAKRLWPPTSSNSYINTLHLHQPRVLAWTSYSVILLESLRTTALPYNKYLRRGDISTSSQSRPLITSLHQLERIASHINLITTRTINHSSSLRCR
jgi:hypothetical protein